MNHDTPQTTGTPRRADASMTNKADHPRIAPTVETTDFSCRPFGRCGLLPPRSQAPAPDPVPAGRKAS